MADYYDRRTLGRYPGHVAIPSSDSIPNMDQAMPTAFYMAGDGTIRPIAMKSGFGFGGSDNFSFSITSPYFDVPINSYPAGYAYASIISVWAARCIEIRSEAVQRIKRSVVDKRTKKPLHNHPFEVALRRAQQHGEAIYSLWEHCKLVFGEVFLWPVQNDFGFYSDLSWLNNLGMNVLTIGGKIGGYSYAPVSGGRMHQFAPGQLAFYKTLNLFNNLRGLSPLDSILLELGIDKDVSRVTKAWYANDARPGVLLIPEVDLSIPTAKEFMDYWKENYQGAKNAGKPVLMPSAIKDVKDMQQRPQIDDVEVRESMRREICARFGVPLSIVGAWDDAQYQSAPEQRKSLYEETIIPECEDLDKWFTLSVLPYFDDSGQTEIKSDFADIKALIEDESIKASVSNQRYLAGGISFNEYRRELGKPPIPDDFFVRPQGYTIVPFGEVGKPTPAPTMPPSSPFGGGFGTSAEKPSLPTPDAPAQTVGKPQIGGGVSKANGHKAHAQSDDTSAVADELAAWRRKAMNGGAAKALAFVCYALPKELESHIRAHLKPTMDKAALKAVFDEAEGMLKPEVSSNSFLGQTPNPSLSERAIIQDEAVKQESLEYWKHYDELQNDVAKTWLHDYEDRVLEKLLDVVHGNISDSEIQSILDSFKDDLLAKWIGTEREPGSLLSIALAGMYAGQASLEKHVAANPDKPVATKANLLTIDWSLLPRQALDFLQHYAFDLIKQIDETTKKQIRAVIEAWIKSGDPLAELKKQLTSVIKDPVRAENIAESESGYIYNEAAFTRWQNAGVTQARWMTVMDDLVCAICRRLNGQVSDIATGWTDPETGIVYRASAHPRDRCFRRPVLEI